MHCLLILSALFVGSLAAPAGGWSRPSNNGNSQTNAGLNGAPQIIPNGNGGAGGYSRQYGGANQANTGAEQAAGAASVSTNNGVPVVGGSPLGGAGAGGASVSTNNGVAVGAGYGGYGGNSNAAADPMAGQNVGGGGASNNADAYGNGAYGNGAAGAPVIIPNNNPGGASQAGGEVNQAGLLAGQALTAQGMSAGAAAGIAIGVIAVAALGTAVAVMILRR